jgi:hypothetical protein
MYARKCSTNLNNTNNIANHIYNVINYNNKPITNIPSNNSNSY